MLAHPCTQMKLCYKSSVVTVGLGNGVKNNQGPGQGGAGDVAHPPREPANAFSSTPLQEMEQGRNYYSNVPVTLNKT